MGEELVLVKHNSFASYAADPGDVIEDPGPVPPGPVEPILDAVQSIYVCRKVLNADEIRAWAKANGFPVALPEEEMHVTLVYSRDPVDWDKVGPPEKDGLVVPADHARWVEQFGDNAVVLTISSPALQLRHFELRSKGIQSDYTAYRPHITLSYQTPPDLNIEALTPFTGAIKLGPEIWDEVGDKPQFVEDFEEELIERHPKGDPRGGQFAPKSDVLKEFKDVGLNLMKVDDIPFRMVEQLKLREPSKTPHPLMLKATLDAFREVRESGSRAGALIRATPINVVYADYDPNDAAMQTGRVLKNPANPSEGYDHYMIVNTTSPFLYDRNQAGSYSAVMGADVYDETKDLEKVMYEVTKAVTVHEMGHVLDNVTSNDYSRGLADILRKAFQDSPHADLAYTATGRFMEKEISHYALASVHEAAAEAGTRYFKERKLAPPMDAWAKWWWDK